MLKCPSQNVLSKVLLLLNVYEGNFNRLQSDVFIKKINVEVGVYLFQKSELKLKEGFGRVGLKGGMLNLF